MTNAFSLSKLLVATLIVTAAMLAWLALSPASYGGHDHDHSKIAAIMSVARLDGGPSCTHSRNTHYHDSGRTKHTTTFHSSYRSGGYHHHRGELLVAKSGALYSTLF